MNESSRKSRFAITAILLGLAFSSCRTPDPTFLGSSLQPLESMPRAFYRIAIAPVKIQKASVGEPDATPVSGAQPAGGIEFVIPTSEIHVEIARQMEAFHAATEIMVVSAPDAAEVRDADFLIVPELRRVPELSYIEISGGAWLSSLLWATTWIGGLGVEDATYGTRTEMDFSIKNPHEDIEMDRVPTVSERVDLAFLDRNPLISWNTLQSFFLPSFLTTDNEHQRARTLSERVCKRLAGQLTRYLKEDMEANLLCNVKLYSPAENGEVVLDSARLAIRGRITAADEITGFEVRLNGDSKAVITKKKPDMGIGAQRRAAGYVYLLEESVDLPLPGKNTIAMMIKIGTKVTYRTLFVERRDSTASKAKE